VRRQSSPPLCRYPDAPIFNGALSRTWGPVKRSPARVSPSPARVSPSPARVSPSPARVSPLSIPSTAPFDRLRTSSGQVHGEGAPPAVKTLPRDHRPLVGSHPSPQRGEGPGVRKGEHEANPCRCPPSRNPSPVGSHPSPLGGEGPGVRTPTKQKKGMSRGGTSPFNFCPPSARETGQLSFPTRRGDVRTPGSRPGCWWGTPAAFLRGGSVHPLAESALTARYAALRHNRRNKQRQRNRIYVCKGYIDRR